MNFFGGGFQEMLKKTIFDFKENSLMHQNLILILFMKEGGRKRQKGRVIGGGGWGEWGGGGGGGGFTDGQIFWPFFTK